MCFWGCPFIIPPRTEAVSVSSAIRTKNSRLDCFHGFAAVLTVHEEIISTKGRNFKKCSASAGHFCYLLENVEINPLWDFRYVANATRYSCRSICFCIPRQRRDMSKAKGIYLISSLNEVKAYRICRKANISSSTLTNISTIYVHIFKEYKAKSR